MALTSYSALLGGDWGIFQTVNAIKGVVMDAVHDPSGRIRRRAESILRLSPERNEVAEVQDIFYWVQAHFHYVNDPVNYEFVKSPILLDQEIDSADSFMGDCDDASAYLAAILIVVGYPAALVIVTPN